MAYADLHCDTFSKLLRRRDAGEDVHFAENDLQIDLARLERAGCTVQNFAMFVPLDRVEDPTRRVFDMIDLFDAEMAANAGRIRHARSLAEIEENRRAGLVSAVLTVEEGGVCRGDVEILCRLHARGVRMLTMTWNFENELGFGAAVDQTRGLKPRGIEFLEEMERLGVIADVSHLSDAGFWDVKRRSRRPFCASHSNARALCPHRRNLTDGMISAVADSGGVIGLNYYGEFLSPDGASTMALIARHARHIADRGGAQCLALGSDFDGFCGETEMRDCTCVPRLADAFAREGFSEDEIDGIMHKNALRFYGDALK